MALRGSFVQVTTVLINHILEYCAQVPGSKPGEDFVEVVLVDEEAVGTADISGCGAKVLHRSSVLEHASRPPGSTVTMVCLLLSARRIIYLIIC